MSVELAYDRGGVLAIDHVATVEQAEERAREYHRGSENVVLLRVVENGLQIRSSDELRALRDDLAWNKLRGR